MCAARAFAVSTLIYLLNICIQVIIVSVSLISHDAVCLSCAFAMGARMYLLVSNIVTQPTICDRLALMVGDRSLHK